MATADASPDLEGTPLWSVKAILGYVVWAAIFMLMGYALVQPAVLIAGELMPDSRGVIILAGLGMSLLAAGRDTGEEASFAELLERVQQWTQAERAYFVVTSLVILFSAFSVTAGVYGVLITLAADTMNTGSLLFVAAMLAPAIDVLIARKIGISAGVFGIYLAVFVMRAVAVVRDMQSEIPTQAGLFVRGFF